MAELLAAALLIAGAAIALIAAIGVARLPDAFLRMHAATKAGVVGASFILLGAGFAFGSAEAWWRVVAIVIFLLVTVPISSHALGRAAYLGGAAMWSGTRIDELAGVLPRATPAPAQPPETAAMSDDPAPAAPPRRRILLALAQGDDSAAALDAGLRAVTLEAGLRPVTLEAGLRPVAAPAAEVTILSLLCAPSLSQTGPLPIGGAHYARRLVETRLARAREQAGLLAQQVEAMAEAARLPAATRHEEGDALHLLLRVAAHHDVTVLPRGAWFDQAQVLDDGMAEARARSLAVPGLLLATPALPGLRAMHFLHEADAGSGVALKRFLTLDLFAGLPLTISVLDLPGAEAALAEALALARARGRAVQAGAERLHPDHPAPLEAFSGASLAVIPARSGSGRLAWRSLREMPHALLLA